MSHINAVGSSYGPSVTATEGPLPKDRTAAQLAELMGADEATVAALVESGASVTPESIMGLLEGRVSNIDRQIQGLTAAIDERTELARELGERNVALGDLREALAALPGDDAVVVDGLEVNGVPLKEFLESNGLLGEVHFTHEGGETKLSKTAIDGLIAQTSERQRAANSGNELDMIRLQSVMQQRSQAITMASNMIKSIHDTLKSIVSNLR